jgi:hypothetical protein
MSDRTSDGGGASGLAQFFRPVEDEDTDKPDQFHAMRLIKHEQFLYRKYNDHTTRETRLMREACPGPRLTTFLNGSVYFPYDRRDHVMEQVARDIEVDSPAYWNQIAYDVPGEGCRLAVDLDGTRVVPVHEVAAICRVLWSTLRLYYPDGPGIPLMVSTCGPRLKKGVLSTGVHIICHVRVTIEQARQILFGFEMRLVADRTIDTSGLEVDASIYKVKARMVSLRMVYSSKIEPCPVCQNTIERRLACQACAMRGVSVSTYTYQPVFAVAWATGHPCTELFHATHTTFDDVVASHSLWPGSAEQPRADYTIPVGDPVCSVGACATVRRIPAHRLEDDGVSVVVEEGLRRLEHSSVNGAPWPSVTVTGVRVVSARKAHIFVDGVGSTRCLYADKTHGSNRVWFILHRTGELVLYCHSKKAEYTCQSKERIRFHLSLDVVRKVFGVPVITNPLASIQTPDMRRFNTKRPLEYSVGVPRQAARSLVAA